MRTSYILGIVLGSSDKAVSKTKCLILGSPYSREQKKSINKNNGKFQVVISAMSTKAGEETVSGRVWELRPLRWPVSPLCYSDLCRGPKKVSD